MTTGTDGAKRPDGDQEDGTTDEQKALQAEINGLISAANGIAVFDEETRREAEAFVNGVMEREEKVELLLGKERDSAYSTWKGLCEKIKLMKGPCTEVKQIVSRKIGSFIADQERAAKEEQAKAQKIAAEAAKAQQQLVADTLRNEGRVEEASAIESRPVSAPVATMKARTAPRPLPPEATKDEPKSTAVTTWEYEITDPQQIPRMYLMPNEKAIQGAVDGAKENTAIPGIRVYPVTGVRFSRGKKK